MNKKVIAILATGVLILGGCDANNDGPQPEVPTFNPEPSVTTTEPLPTPSEKPTPSTAPTTTPGAEPPATQFAKKWGLANPGISESTILKTANNVCDIIKGDSAWLDNPLTLVQLTEEIVNGGFKASDTQNFVKDAALNYCGSVSNPT